MSSQATFGNRAGREAYYACLMRYASGQGNDHALACMLASQLSGESAMPGDLGLPEPAFLALMDFHFRGYEDIATPCVENSLDVFRGEEQAELIDLMTSHRAGKSLSERWIATIVAAGCLGSDHLWQDLGLWCRDDLTGLMQHNFPALAAKNINNMKWKKFLYKQLCIGEGIYVCRSPSCEVCVDYQDCFGPEM